MVQFPYPGKFSYSSLYFALHLWHQPYMTSTGSLDCNISTTTCYLLILIFRLPCLLLCIHILHLSSCSTGTYHNTAIKCSNCVKILTNFKTRRKAVAKKKRSYIIYSSRMYYNALSSNLRAPLSWSLQSFFRFSLNVFLAQKRMNLWPINVSRINKIGPTEHK